MTGHLTTTRRPGRVPPGAPVEQRGRQTVDGHTVVVSRFIPSGPAVAAPVVLVHGIGVSGRYFRALARELAADGPVLVPDLPGFGSSPRPGGVLGIADHARVVLELVRREGWAERPVLVGHSMGAQVVTEAAALAPGTAAGLVLVGPVAEPGRRSLAHQAWRLLRDTRHESPRANWLVLTDYLRTGSRWYAATLPHMLGHPLEERLAVVREPVLLLRGEHDPIAPPAYLALLAARAHDARVAQVPGAGHVVMVHDPRTAAALVRSVP